MSLLQKIKENKHLRFIDGETEKCFTLSELTHDFPLNKERTLAFLYLDNSIGSLSAYLSGLQSKHTLVLLNNQLDGMAR